MNALTQTPLFKALLDAMSRMTDGSGFVTRGLAPTAHGGGSLQVDVAVGDYVAGGKSFAYAGGNIVADAAHATLPRVDLIYFSSAGVLSKLAGTAAAAPVGPAIPASAVAIALCRIPALATDFSAGAPLAYVEDVRQIRIDGMPVVNARLFGVTGDGTTDDQAALTSAMANGGIVVLPDGANNAYLCNSDLLIPDQTWLVTLGMARLKMASASLQVGSKSALRWRTGCMVRIEGSSAAGKALIEAYNLLGDHSMGPRQIVATLSATTASDFFHAHSLSSFGYADVKHVLSTANYQCKNGVMLSDGDDATTASVANDFVNGNTFEGTLSCTDNGIRFRGLSPVGGSIVGTIARNKFDRMDVNSFGAPAGAGRGFVCLDTAGSRNEFEICTFEVGAGGATKDIDVGSCVNGQIFRHPICRAKATQTLATRDVWLFDENDTDNDFGIYKIKSNSGVPVTKQIGSGTRTAGDITLASGGALVDATSVTTTITLPAGTSGKVRITVTGSWNGTTGGGAEFAILVDGAVVFSMLDTLSSTGGNQPVSATWLATGLSAAAHTIKLQWRTITTSANLNGGTTANRVTTIVAEETD